VIAEKVARAERLLADLTRETAELRCIVSGDE
jgi:hypothetical protein